MLTPEPSIRQRILNIIINPKTHKPYDGFDHIKECLDRFKYSDKELEFILKNVKSMQDLDGR